MAGYHYEWVPEPNGTVRAITDAEGRFAFDDLPAATRNVKAGNDEGNDDVLVTDDWDEWYLLGYTLQVEGRAGQDGTVRGMPVTRLLSDDGDEPVSAAASKVHRPGDAAVLNDRLANDAGYSEDYYAITLSEVNAQDEEKSVLDGRLVLADRATTEADPVGATDPAYYVGANGMAFDLSTIRDADCMNGGFGPFGTAVISGVAWDDANYDGIRNYKIIGGETEEDGSGQDGVVPGEDDAAGDGANGEGEENGDAGEGDDGEEPGTLVPLEDPLVGETIYLTQEYYDPHAAGGAGAWVHNPAFGNPVDDPHPGDLTATDSSVSVRHVTDNTQYSIEGFGYTDGNGDWQPLWLADAEDADFVTVFPWEDKYPGRFRDGMTVTALDGTTHTIEIKPNTQYGVICRQQDRDGNLVTSQQPFYVATRGATAVAGVPFAEGDVDVTAAAVTFTEREGWWKEVGDDAIADVEADPAWDGWEYAAVPEGATAAEIAAHGSWAVADEAGIVSIEGLAQRTGYQLVARLRTAGDPTDSEGSEASRIAATRARDAVIFPDPDGTEVWAVRTPADKVGDSNGYLPEGLPDTPENRQGSVKPAPPGSLSTTTGADGGYRFGALQCYVQKDAAGDLVDYGVPGAADEVFQTRYRVYMAELNNGYVMSRFHVGGPDSDLTRSEEGALTLRQAITYRNGMTIDDGYAYLSRESTNKPDSVFGSQYDDDADDKKVAFDVPAPSGTVLDAGAKAPNLNTVSGTVWNDGNRNGLREEGEAGITGATVELTRYWYDGEEDQWVFDRDFNRLVDAQGNVVQPGGATVYLSAEEQASTCRVVTTGRFERRVKDFLGEEQVIEYPQGYYEFNDLPATEVRVIGNAEQTVVYGYRVNVVDMPRGFAVTGLNSGEDIETDSDLDEATTRLDPEGEVAVDGLMVLAMAADDADAEESKVDGPDGLRWSTLGSRSSHFNDAGLIPFAGTSVSGWVWKDADKDGLQAEDDELVIDAEVVLERSVATFADAVDAGWMSRITDGAPGSDLDAEGNPLQETKRYLDIAWIVDGAEPPVEEPPVSGGDEVPGSPDEDEDESPVDPDGGNSEGSADSEGDTGSGGDPAEGAGGDDAADEPAYVTALTWVTRVYGLDDGADDAGDGDAGDGVPGGSDADNPDDGNADDGEGQAAARLKKLLAMDVPDPAADLDRNQDDGVLSEGIWERVAATKTDLEGGYSFVGLPAVDGYGRPYVYRVRMEKPTDAEWVPLNVGEDDNLDNDVAHMNLRGEDVDDNVGISEPLGVLSPRGAPNAYGVAYQVLAPQQWTRDAGRAVDPGYYVEPDPVPDPGEEDDWMTEIFQKDWLAKVTHKLLPQTGDPASLLRLILASLAGLAAMMLVLSLLRRREEEEPERWVDITI